jgi:hypothetical protein
MAISDNVREITDRIDHEVNNNPPGPDGIRSDTARKVHGLAMNAILGGMEDRVKYMMLYAKTIDELARLIPTDGSNSDEQRAARAYLVANGMCTDDTTPHTQMGVGKVLDQQP